MRGGCFAIRIGLFIAAATVGLFVYGINELVQATRFAKPVTLSYAEFMKRRPTEGWFHITRCMLAVIDEAHIIKEKPGSQDDPSLIHNAYVPVFDKDATFTSLEQVEKRPINLLVYTQDDATIQHIREMLQMGNEKNDKKFEEYFAKHPDALFPTRDVEGMLKAGLNDEATETQTKLQSAYPNRDAYCPILEEGKRPSIAAGIGCTVAALLLVAGQLLYYARKLINRGISGGAMS